MPELKTGYATLLREKGPRFECNNGVFKFSAYNYLLLLSTQEAVSTYDAYLFLTWKCLIKITGNAHAKIDVNVIAKKILRIAALFTNISTFKYAIVCMIENM